MHHLQIYIIYKKKRRAMHVEAPVCLPIKQVKTHASFLPITDLMSFTILD